MKEDQQDSKFKTVVCSTMEIFGFILFPVVLFSLFYMTKMKNILKYTNRSKSNYNIVLVALMVTNLVVGIMDRVIFNDDDRFDINNFFIIVVTLVLTILYFLNKILLKNTFIVLFIINLLLVFIKHVFKQLSKLYDYCYGDEEVMYEEDIHIERKI